MVYDFFFKNYLDCSITTEGIPCAFPFVYNGTTYTKCTGEPDIWCSTKNYPNGTTIDEQWGYCNDNCPSEG